MIHEILLYVLNIKDNEIQHFCNNKILFRLHLKHKRKQKVLQFIR